MALTLVRHGQTKGRLERATGRRSHAAQDCVMLGAAHLDPHRPSGLDHVPRAGPPLWEHDRVARNAAAGCAVNVGQEENAVDDHEYLRRRARCDGEAAGRGQQESDAGRDVVDRVRDVRRSVMHGALDDRRNGRVKARRRGNDGPDNAIRAVWRTGHVLVVVDDPNLVNLPVMGLLLHPQSK